MFNAQELKRIERLVAFSTSMVRGEVDKKVIEDHQEDLSRVTPQEVMQITYQVWQQGVPRREILRVVDRLIHVFHLGLGGYVWDKPDPDSFLGLLRQENECLLERMQALKELLKKKDVLSHKMIIETMVRDLSEIEKHYQKKENILFPMMEKKKEQYRGLSVMWALHDQARASLKKLASLLLGDDEQQIIKELGHAFFNLIGLVQKEEFILYPCAVGLFEHNDLEQMLVESMDYGFAWLDEPLGLREKVQVIKEKVKMGMETDQWLYQSETGTLNLNQLTLLLSHLPLDLTLVDEDNKVRFFSKPKDRFFPRSPSIIGRDVHQCHPPDSVHKVEEILQSFRQGDKDHARFWIHIKDRFLLIQYFALRDEQGVYRGTLEASQDITEIHELEGERRLVDWGN